MLIDEAIAMFEDVEGEEHKQVLVHLKEAQAYDVGGVDALLRYLRKREKLTVFLDTVSEHPGTPESLTKMGRFIWMEGIANSPFGCLIVFDPVECRTDAHLVDPQKREYAKLTCLDEDETWRYIPSGEPAGNSPLRIIQLLLTTAYLASNPVNQIVTVQQPRDEKRNKRSTKVLRPRRQEVRCVIIDGVERIPNPATGTPTFKVHARGWHCRRHKVTEHFRVYQSGKVVKIRAHERGDITRGYVPWFSGNYFDTPQKPRYRVQPDKSFFTIDAGSGGVDR
jgi:hypothetical protein